MRRHLLLLSALLACTAAQSQSLGYQDADTPSEAVGMMNSTLVMAAKMYSECSKRFPDLAEGMNRDFTTWKTKEARDIGLARFHWAEMEKSQPKLQGMKAYAESAIVQQLQLAEGRPEVGGVDGGKVVRDMCTSHFANLASGIWRDRTPRAYQYLDQAPDLK